MPKQYNNERPFNWTGRRVWILRMPGGKRCVAATIVNVRRSALQRRQFAVSVQMDDGGVCTLETAEWGTRWGFDRRKNPRPGDGASGGGAAA
jgi:hypothetical protein